MSIDEAIRLATEIPTTPRGTDIYSKRQANAASTFKLAASLPRFVVSSYENTTSPPGVYKWTGQPMPYPSLTITRSGPLGRLVLVMVIIYEDDKLYASLCSVEKGRARPALSMVYEYDTTENDWVSHYLPLWETLDPKSSDHNPQLLEFAQLIIGNAVEVLAGIKTAQYLTTQSIIKPRGKKKSGRTLPLVTLHTVTINPNPPPVTTATSGQPTGIRQREHWRRGTWCTIKRTGTRYWRSACKAGDASLGVIIKDYVIEGNKDEPSTNS
jgi:hypothetical protein